MSIGLLNHWRSVLRIQFPLYFESTLLFTKTFWKPRCKCKFNIFNQKETIQHLLVDCKFTKRLYCFLSSICNFDFCQLSASKFIQNIAHNKPKHITNVLLLITKQYIYRKRCLSKKPSILELQKEISRTYFVELYRAKENNQISHFQKKWSPVKTCIFIMKET